MWVAVSALLADMLVVHLPTPETWHITGKPFPLHSTAVMLHISTALWFPHDDPSCIFPVDCFAVWPPCEVVEIGCTPPECPGHGRGWSKERPYRSLSKAGQETCLRWGSLSLLGSGIWLSPEHQNPRNRQNPSSGRVGFTLETGRRNAFILKPACI